MVPVITVLGLHMGTLIGGTVLVEFVFNWPGLSGYLVAAVEARDYPEVVGIVLVVSFIFVFLNLLVDIGLCRARSAGEARRDDRAPLRSPSASGRAGAMLVLVLATPWLPLADVRAMDIPHRFAGPSWRASARARTNSAATC